MLKANGLRKAAGIAALCALCATAGAVMAERQPHMEDAMRLLKDARAALNQAENDKGGHRTKALDHIDRAIDEVKQGMKFAERH